MVASLSLFFFVRRVLFASALFACDDQGSSMSTLDDDDDAPFVVALEQRGDAI